MNNGFNHINELKVSAAFSKQSKVFDEYYNDDDIIQYKRERVRKHVLQQLLPNSFLLELNCGTGEDALFFAQKGHFVHATDISCDMLQKLQVKLNCYGYSNKISLENCSFTSLSCLKNKGPFDHIFSNFGGLNCTAELDKVIQQFSSLLNTGGKITLVVISKFCLWELLLVFKGKFKTALRRFFSNKGRKANVEGIAFACWYYKPSYIIKNLRNDFDLLSVEGLCTIVPPSYMKDFGKKYPLLFKVFKKWENKLASKWPFRYWGDYYIISLQKR